LSYIELESRKKVGRMTLLDAARFYELDRWESGRGMLPYDLVKSAGAGVADSNRGSLPGYLRKILFQLDPAVGLHLLDLDARFVYPEIGIQCVRRLECGVVGRFQEGAPVSPNGYEAYRRLSEDIPRYVAGVIEGGRAALIYEGKIQAEYRDHG